MDTKSVIEIQKKGIFMHRLVYVIFILQRLLLQFEMKDVSVRNTVCILSFIVLCEAVEEIFFYANYFNNIMVIRAVRYGQCLLATMVLVFLQISDDSEVMIIALLIMLMVDFFLTMDITERGRAVFYVMCIGMPMLIVVLLKWRFIPAGNGCFYFLIY